MKRIRSSRKQPGDSSLTGLPFERQAEIADYAANHTLAETVEWLATQSVRISLSTLSRFLRWYRLREELERNAMTVETLLADLRCQEPNITPERLQQLGQNFFGRMVLQLQDPRLWLLSQELELKKHRLQLDWQKHRDLIELRKAAIQRALNVAKSTEGISKETLEQIEAELKLM